jgi:hypothetical protein
LISSGVNASAALACRVERLIIVNQKMRQLKLQNVASRLTSRSAGQSPRERRRLKNFNGMRCVGR